MSKRSNTANRIPLVPIPITKEEATRQAEANLEKIKKVEAFEDNAVDFLWELRQETLPKAKMNRLKKAADKINAAVMPYSACKSGCSYCCHISAVITQTEADQLAAATGRKALKLSGRADMEASQKKWYKVPCPFLKNGKCSAYDQRPLVCRLLIVLSDSAHYCNTDIPSAESHVTSINLTQLQEGYVMAYLNEAWADIRDFFPPNGKP